MLEASMMASLHNHTDKGSLLDSTLSVDRLVSQAKELNYRAVAITEHGTMHTYIDFWKSCQKHGIKGIIGCEVYETDNLYYKESDAKRYHLLLLAKNNTGLKNLMKIVSVSHTEGYFYKPRVDRDLLRKYSEGLICTTACLASRVMRLLVEGACPCCKKLDGHKEDCDYESDFKPNWEEAKKEIEIYKEIFGENFYIELQSHSTEDQKIGNQRILKLAKECKVKTIVSFDSHMESGDSKTMDIHRKFIQISQDREVDTTYKDCFQQDMETMYSIMREHMSEEDIDNAVLGTSEIADKCNVDIELGQSKMPHMELPSGFKTEIEYFRYLLKEGWKSRGIDKLPKEKQKEYEERIETEIPVLQELGYIDYYIMNHQLLNKLSKVGIPRGFARGSCAGSICFYLLFVTEIDSIRWDLDFSRFANLGRKVMPDVDTDISKYRRMEALEITEELFGKENVAQVCTFNSLSSKVCIRDLGKVFHQEGTYDLPYKIRDKIAKLVPEGLDIEQALEESSDLKRYEKKYPLLFEYTKALQNKPKSVGCHASAIAVSDRPIVELSPLMLNKDGRNMIHLEMNNAQDDVGLIKLDLLGLATLDIIDNTLKFAGLTWEDIHIDKINLNDKNVFREIYAKGETIGIFQMESYVAQNILKKLQPTHIENIISVNALNRPALLSIGMDKVFIHNQHNPQDTKYIHEDLKPIFSKTNGVMLYQEQALAVLRLAKSFDLEEIDNVRRAIGKKKLDLMEKAKEQFFEGFKKQKWRMEQIEELWEWLVQQSTYSFNRSHSVAYALLSYITAYLKYYYPTEFMTALLINAIGDYEETSKIMSECNRMGITVLNPHINKSERYYTKGNETDILFGFVSIKGVGKKAVDVIMEEREKGKFKSFLDFYERCKLNTTTFISLIKAGAFGNNKEHKRKLLLKYAELTADRKVFKPVKTVPQRKVMYKYGLIQEDKEYKDKARMLQIYNKFKEEKHNREQDEKVKKHLTTFKEKYMKDESMFEFETLSMFLNGNPYDKYLEYFKDYDEYLDGHEKMLLGGTITSVDRKKSKNGTTYAYIELLFPNGMIREGMAFNQVYTEYQDLIKTGQNVVMLAKKSGGQFIVNKMKTFDVWKEEIEQKKKKLEGSKS